VVELDPQLGAGGGVIGDRGVVAIVIAGGPISEAGDENRAPGGADNYRIGLAAAVADAGVALDPQLGAGGSAVRDRGIVGSVRRIIAVPGDEHRLPGRADSDRASLVDEVAGAVVTLDPQLGAGTGRRD
jgi:hypothetical protein